MNDLKTPILITCANCRENVVGWPQYMICPHCGEDVEHGADNALRGISIAFIIVWLCLFIALVSYHWFIK
jgi:predicted amidophosphoribosyltransferase